MTPKLAVFLLDAAAWIAPVHRRDWIAGLRAETEFSPRPVAWARGALLTALQQRMIDMLNSRQALRLLLGAFVIATAAFMVPFLGFMIHWAQTQVMDARNARHLVLGFVFVSAVVLLLSSGGLAIIFSTGRSRFNRYGRGLFSIGGLFMGVSLPYFAYLGFMRFHKLTVPPAPVSALSLIAAPLFVAAAVALLWRRTRLFVPLATAALGLEVAQFAMQWPSLPVHEAADYVRGFFGACLPGLLMLAATGLLLERKTPASL